jgi:arginyl-tRNA synthetase
MCRTSLLTPARSYLADILCSLIDCDPITAYNSIQWPNDIFTADLTIHLPKLSYGADLTALAIHLMQRVRHSLSHSACGIVSLTAHTQYFPSCPLFIFPLRGVHLRIMFMSKTLPRLVLPYISDRKDSYGKDPSIGLRDPSSPDLGRKRLVEFSSPNIGSELHGKHLRSTILGGPYC